MSTAIRFRRKSTSYNFPGGSNIKIVKLRKWQNYGLLLIGCFKTAEIYNKVWFIHYKQYRNGVW